MNLDLRTMMVMIAALSLLFSGLLTFSGLQAGNVRGVRQWAIGSLCIGLGLGFSYTQVELPVNPWVMVIGSTLTLMGGGFQYNGIQVFKNGYCNKHLPWLIGSLAFFQTMQFAVIDPNIRLRAIANSLLFFCCNAACAHALFTGIDQPLRTAYWFTATSFSVVAITFLVRAIVVFSLPADTYSLYSPLGVNPAAFFIGSLAQMSVVFGLLSMLNYRLTNDHKKLASLDALTGVMNRRSLDIEASRIIARCSRTGETLAVMMIDIDHFKSVNDRYGHLVGDEVLRRFAVIAQSCIRNDDYLARYGGEEFCILLPACQEKDAWMLAERIRQVFAETIIEFAGETLLSTISIGVADSRHVSLDLSPLLVAADKALYKAKHEGRNRVIMYSSDAYA